MKSRVSREKQKAVKLDRYIRKTLASNEKTLDLSLKMMSSIPAKVLDATKIEILNLCSNKLEEFPQLGKLKSLRDLNLSWNKIPEIPTAISGLISLQKLDMSFNTLSRISPFISFCKQLRFLILNDNSLTELPCSLGDCEKLTKMNLEFNQITRLPKTITKLKFKSLRLTGNPLEWPPPTIAFAGTEALREFFAGGSVLNRLQEGLVGKSWKRLDTDDMNRFSLPRGSPRLQHDFFGSDYDNQPEEFSPRDEVPPKPWKVMRAKMLHNRRSQKSQKKPLRKYSSLKSHSAMSIIPKRRWSHPLATSSEKDKESFRPEDAMEVSRLLMLRGKASIFDVLKRDMIEEAGKEKSLPPMPFEKEEHLDDSDRQFLADLAEENLVEHRLKMRRKSYEAPQIIDQIEERALSEIPDEFICPITYELMRDPVVLSDGHTYEKSAIEEWLKKHGKSPLTGGTLITKTLTPNYCLRKLIGDFVSKHKK